MLLAQPAGGLSTSFLSQTIASEGLTLGMSCSELISHPPQNCTQEVYQDFTELHQFPVGGSVPSLREGGADSISSSLHHSQELGSASPQCIHRT